MAADAITILEALGLGEFARLGFSLGGMTAQQIACERPKFLRRLVLVGTWPRGGEGMTSFTPEVQSIFGGSYDPPDEPWLKVMFAPTKSSQSFLERIRARQPIVIRPPPPRSPRHNSQQ